MSDDRRPDGDDDGHGGGTGDIHPDAPRYPSGPGSFVHGRPPKPHGRLGHHAPPRTASKTKAAAKDKTAVSTYQAALVEAAERLKPAGFGNAVDRNRYDSRYWHAVIQTMQDQFTGAEYKEKALKSQVAPAGAVYEYDVTPSRALMSMFEAPGSWSFDCAQFAQAVQLYALLAVIGPAAYDKRVGTPFYFKFHNSTGLKIKDWWVRAPGVRTHHYDAAKDTLVPIGSVADTLEDKFRSAPAGSEIVFRNADAPDTSIFYNENTVKLNQDLFIAHGFGTEKLMSRKQIEDGLVRANLKARAPAPGSLQHAEYIRKNIFVRQVIIFEIPGVQ